MEDTIPSNSILLSTYKKQPKNRKKGTPYNPTDTYEIVFDLVEYTLKKLCGDKADKWVTRLILEYDNDDLYQKYN